MLIATILGVLLVPMLYVMVEKIIGAKQHAPVPAGAAPPPPKLATQHGQEGH